MYQTGIYRDYEIAYRRERLREAGTGHREQRGRRLWATRPVRRHDR
jgi:hypothetical protein